MWRKFKHFSSLEDDSIVVFCNRNCHVLPFCKMGALYTVVTFRLPGLRFKASSTQANNPDQQSFDLIFHPSAGLLGVKAGGLLCHENLLSTLLYGCPSWWINNRWDVTLRSNAHLILRDNFSLALQLTAGYAANSHNHTWSKGKTSHVLYALY